LFYKYILPHFKITTTAKKDATEKAEAGRHEVNNQITYLFPVTVVLSLVVAVFRLINQLSNMALSLLAFLLLLLGLAVMLLLQDTVNGLGILGILLLISPFGLPLIITFLIEMLGLFKDMLKEI
jgi:uncharacterized membrane protein YGL010W